MAAVLRVLSLIGLLLALSSCLGTSEEIFGSDQATLVPGIEGDYVEKDGSAENALRVQRIAGSSDYAYFDPKRPETDRGRLRAVSVGGDMYLVQMREDKWPAGRYWQLLFKIERENNAVTRMVVLWSGDDAVTALAAQSGIEFGPPFEGDASGPQTLKGSREAIAAFLKKIPTLPLDEVGSYVRK
jgi:hypothetical protein